jgi:Laminin B (Domain IV)/PEP-CTERM motif
MSRRVLSTLLLGICVFTLNLTCALGGIVSDFSTGDEGWQVVSFENLTTDNFAITATYNPTLNLTGGNPGGFISTSDQDNGDLTFSAPAKFLGNVSGATGLSYDLIYPVGAINYQPTDVILMGNGETLLWKNSPDIVPGPSWMSVNLDFVPSTEWHVGTSNGARATVSDFGNVLGNLSGLFIRGDYTTGLVETPGLDNVGLAGVSAPVPEPSTLAMMAIAAVTVATFRQSRLMGHHFAVGQRMKRARVNRGTTNQ